MRIASLAVILTPLLGATLQAQSVLLPSSATAAPGGSTDNVSWGNYTPAGWAGLRLQVSYSHDHFLARGIGGPIQIQGIWFRSGSGGIAPFGAVNLSGVGVAMSTGRFAATALDPEFALNHGPDETPVFYGPVQVQSVTAQGVMYVHIPFQTPFVYDWTAGDLLLDISYLYSGLSHLPVNTAAKQGDAVAGGGGIVFGPWNAQFATNSHAGVQVMQLDYAVVPGAATLANRGFGCSEQSISGYEFFSTGANSFDLAGAAPARIAYVRNGDRYVVNRGAANLAVPASPTNLALGDDTCSAPIPLPFSFPYLDRNGVVQSTNQIVVASNGYVWLDGAQTVSDYSPTAGEFCGFAARIAAHWLDLTPNLGGTISYGTSAGGEFHISWTAVPEYNHAANTVTAQISLASSGSFHIDFGPTTPFAPSATGFSPGLGAAVTDSLDLSAAVNLRLGRDAVPLVAVPITRPVLGTNQIVRVENILSGTVLGVYCLGLTPAQVDLTVIGMPGCTRWLTWDVTHLLLPNGSASVNWQMSIPNDAGLVGLPIYGQAAMFSPGLNALGIVVSNAVVATVGH